MSKKHIPHHIFSLHILTNTVDNIQNKHENFVCYTLHKWNTLRVNKKRTTALRNKFEGKFKEKLCSWLIQGGNKTCWVNHCFHVIQTWQYCIWEKLMQTHIHTHSEQFMHTLPGALIIKSKSHHWPTSCRQSLKYVCNA